MTVQGEKLAHKYLDIENVRGRAKKNVIIRWRLWSEQAKPIGIGVSQKSLI